MDWNNNEAKSAASTYAGVGSIGSISNQPPATPQLSATERLNNRLEDVLQAVRQCADRAESIANRHLGHQGENAAKDGAATLVPNGSLARANRALDDITGALSALSGQLSRLDQI